MRDIIRFVNKVILILGIILISTWVLYSQSREELQNRKLKTEEDIKVTNELLEKTQKTKTAGLNRLLIIKKRISLREKLIGEISEEVDLLEKDITEKENDINRYENELKKLKEEYAKMIYFAYKNRNNYDRLMFILSAEDFNQSYRRMKYLQQYTQYRKKQANKIVETQKNLQYDVEQLKEYKNKKVESLARKEKEKRYLGDERNKKNNEIGRLKRKEKGLREKIRENERIKKQLENEIAELVAREAAANETHKTLTVREEVTSRKFKGQKGKLRWPINGGVVLREYGEHQHPVIKGVKIKNEGIDVGVSKDVRVKAIYEGEVKKVIAVPGANMAVIIRHGHYLSLYSNIVNVTVKPGDVVGDGHYLGDVYVSQNGDNNSVLHLRIYEEMEVLNPKFWLRKK